MYKRICALVFGLVLLCTMLPVSSRAVGAIDTDAEVSLTVCAEKENGVLSGAKFALYLVANVDVSGELTVTEDFSRFAADISGAQEEGWPRIAQALEGWTVLAEMEPVDTGATDETGVLAFPTGEKKLAQGLYLVVGDIHTQDAVVYTPVPILVMLPTLDKNTDAWAYQLLVYPKMEAKPESSEAISRKVLKVWDDKGYETKRPEEITVHLLKDDSIYDTVKLSESNGWSYTWQGLDPHAKWIIAEDVLKDYTVEITREGITFVITNRYCGETPPPPTKPDGGNLPQTGQLWWPVPGLMALGLAFVVLGAAKRRGNGYEK